MRRIQIQTRTSQLLITHINQVTNHFVSQGLNLGLSVVLNLSLNLVSLGCLGLNFGLNLGCLGLNLTWNLGCLVLNFKFRLFRFELISI
jgi:hypothetical protein